MNKHFRREAVEEAPALIGVEIAVSVFKSEFSYQYKGKIA